VTILLLPSPQRLWGRRSDHRPPAWGGHPRPAAASIAAAAHTRGLQAALDAACAAHPDKRLTLWFQDEARFGQNGRVCHRWFTRGQRPTGLCDQRYTWAHIFAAVRPATGEDFALVLPHVSTKAMDVFLQRFAATLAQDEHAALVLDGAGWHTANCKCRTPSHSSACRPTRPS
jgi:hypothetical protein